MWSFIFICLLFEWIRENMLRFETWIVGSKKHWPLTCIFYCLNVKILHTVCCFLQNYFIKFHNQLTDPTTVLYSSSFEQSVITSCKKLNSVGHMNFRNGFFFLYSKEEFVSFNLNEDSNLARHCIAPKFGIGYWSQKQFYSRSLMFRNAVNNSD